MLSIILLLVVFVELRAQLRFSADSVLFEETLYGAVDTVDVMIYNDWSSDISVVITGFEVYGNVVVYPSQSSVQIASLDSQEVQLFFQPEHNIIHAGNILFNSDYLGATALPFKAVGRFSRSYYDPSFNKHEESLKNSLKSIISQGYSSQGYNGARDEMYGDLDNVNGDVTCVYTGRVASFNTRPGANANSFNCEHTFPQGKFNSNEPMKSDIHHLFPTDVNANSQRGSLPFGAVVNASWTQGGSKKGGSRFEPRDAQKGQTARAMLYFTTRYQDYDNFIGSQEATLKAWNEQYPPLASERQRNDGVQQLQNNRNPFIDYPQFAERISTFTNATSSAKMDDSLFVSVDTARFSSNTQDLIFHVVWYNRGNTVQVLKNFNLSGPGMMWLDGLTDSLILEAGEAVEFSFNTDGNVPVGSTHTFNYTHSSPTSTYSGLILIESGWTPLSVSHPDTAPVFKLYPNPATNVLNWEGDFKVSIFNGLGQLERECTSPCSLNLVPGAYVVRGGGQTQPLFIN